MQIYNNDVISPLAQLVRRSGARHQRGGRRRAAEHAAVDRVRSARQLSHAHRQFAAPLQPSVDQCDVLPFQLRARRQRSDAVLPVGYGF